MKYKDFPLFEALPLLLIFHANIYQKCWQKCHFQFNNNRENTYNIQLGSTYFYIFRYFIVFFYQFMICLLFGLFFLILFLYILHRFCLIVVALIIRIRRNVLIWRKFSKWKINHLYMFWLKYTDILL